MPVTPKTAMDILIENTIYRMSQSVPRDAATQSDLAARTRAACDKLTRYGGAVATPELADVLDKLTDLNHTLHHCRDTLTGHAQIRLIVHLLYVLAEAEGFSAAPPSERNRPWKP